MRLVTWNVNGLRSLVRSDFEAWLAATGFDVICLQEAKVGEDLLTKHWFQGYTSFLSPAHRAGYSGVATLVRSDREACNVRSGLGVPELDAEGRVLTLDVGGVRVINVYAPHSHRKLIRLDVKLRFLRALTAFIAAQRVDGVPLVLMGDFNVAHQDIDLANARANRKNAGFLPEERAWVSGLLEDGFIDAFRALHAEAGHYTWWSMRKGVRERNIGWRLDYAFIDASLRPRLETCSHLVARAGSDHCPVLIELRS